MSFQFLIPLGMSAIAFWLYKRSPDEMAYLAAVIAIVSLLVSLVLAPWQVQLLLLAILALSARQFSLSPDLSTGAPLENPIQDREDETNPVTDAERIALCYRGRDYEVNSVKVETIEREIQGQYRGAPVKFYTPKKESESNSSA